MKMNETILVTENWNGKETNYLSSFEDYKSKVLMDSCVTKNELADAVMDLCESMSDKKHWSEMFCSSNKSVVAKYCSGIDELRSFLHGSLNSSDQEWSFDESRCSMESLETLKAVGIDTNGRGAGIRYDYEAVERTYKQGDILHNFNGIDYLVVEKLTERNLLLLNTRSGEFLVAVSVSFFVRFPKGENPSTHNTMYGIEWGQGIYCSSNPTAIDFKELKAKYGAHKEVETLEDCRDEKKEIFYLYHMLVNSALVSDEVKAAAENSMYSEFSTGREDVFRKNLSDGMYDREFLGDSITVKGRAR